MNKTLSVLADIVVGALLVLTLAALLFPNFYNRVRRHLRPDELHFANERSNRERQLAMAIIIVIAGSVLLGQVRC
jgi:hypothetical protein